MYHHVLSPKYQKIIFLRTLFFCLLSKYLINAYYCAFSRRLCKFSSHTQLKPKANPVSDNKFFLSINTGVWDSSIEKEKVREIVNKLGILRNFPPNVTCFSWVHLQIQITAKLHEKLCLRDEGGIFEEDNRKKTRRMNNRENSYWITRAFAQFSR